MKKRKSLVIHAAFFGILLILVGSAASYAQITFEVTGKKTNKITAGCLKVKLEEDGNIFLTNAIPLSDQEGQNTEPYILTITNTCTIDAHYYVTFNVIDESNLNNIEKVKLSLSGDKTLAPTFIENLDLYNLASAPSYVELTYLIDDGILTTESSKTIELRMWIDYNVTEFEGSIASKIIINTISQEEYNNLTP